MAVEAQFARRLLLVDDEEGVLFTLSSVLKREGYDVLALSTAGEAIKALGDRSFDVVVADMRLEEGRTGLEVVDAARRLDPEVVGIVLTGYVSLESAVDALRGGVANYLAKPCNIEELKLAIARGFEKRNLLRDLEDARREAAAREEAERSRADLQRFADRLTHLQLITSALSRSVTPDEVARVAVEEMARALDARVGLIALLAEDGRSFELTIYTGLDTSQPNPRIFPADARLPAADAISSARPVIVHGRTALERQYPELTRVGLPPDVVAAVAMPLLLEGRSVGAVGLHFTSDRFSDEDRGFFELVAAQCAHALERAQLFERERHARLDAEQARAAAQRDRAHLVDAFGHAPAALALLHGPDHVFTLANPAFLQAAGDRDEAALMGRPAVEAMPDLKDQGYMELLDRVFREGQPFQGYDMSLRVSTPSGARQSYWNFVFQPLRNRSGEVDNILLHGVDVTDRVKATRALEDTLGALRLRDAELLRERDKLQQVIDALPEAVAVTDAEGRMVMRNAASKAITGDAPNEAAPNQANALGVLRLDGSPWHAEETPVARALGQRETVRGEQMVIVDGQNGQRHTILASAAPLLGPDKEVVGAVTVFQDISNIKMLEQQKDDFLSAAAHDLKSPLTLIRGLSQLLLRRVESNHPGVVDVAQSIDDAALRLARLVDELVDVFVLDAPGAVNPPRVPTDLVALARRVAQEEQLLTTHHTVRVTSDEVELIVRCERDRIARVIGNLVDNAIKYSPDGGEVLIAIRLVACAEGKQAALSVRDQGIGVAEADQERVFERFQRGSNTRELPGTGIGLSYARDVVQRHGGSLTVASKVGQGSTFTVMLPLGD